MARFREHLQAVGGSIVRNGTPALVCGPHGQTVGTELECRKYFTAWDPDHRTEVAPGKFQALFADRFDKAVKHTAYDFSDLPDDP